MNAIIKLWRAHGTKILGFLSTIAAGFPLIDGLISDEAKPYWAAANIVFGALTVQRGYRNSKQ